MAIADARHVDNSRPVSLEPLGSTSVVWSDRRTRPGELATAIRRSLHQGEPISRERAIVLQVLFAGIEDVSLADLFAGVKYVLNPSQVEGSMLAAPLEVDRIDNLYYSLASYGPDARVALEDAKWRLSQLPRSSVGALLQLMERDSNGVRLNNAIDVLAELIFKYPSLILGAARASGNPDFRWSVLAALQWCKRFGEGEAERDVEGFVRASMGAADPDWRTAAYAAVQALPLDVARSILESAKTTEEDSEALGEIDEQLLSLEDG